MIQFFSYYCANAELLSRVHRYCPFGAVSSRTRGRVPTLPFLFRFSPSVHDARTTGGPFFHQFLFSGYSRDRLTVGIFTVRGAGGHCEGWKGTGRDPPPRPDTRVRPPETASFRHAPNPLSTFFRISFTLRFRLWRKHQNILAILVVDSSKMYIFLFAEFKNYRQPFLFLESWIVHWFICICSVWTFYLYAFIRWVLSYFYRLIFICLVSKCYFFIFFLLSTDWRSMYFCILNAKHCSFMSTLLLLFNRLFCSIGLIVRWWSSEQPAGSTDVSQSMAS